MVRFNICVTALQLRPLDIIEKMRYNILIKTCKGGS